MAKKRPRKRKIPPKPHPLQKVVISINPRYYADIPNSLYKVLEPMKSAIYAYYFVQEQSDSGDFLVFFRTRWRPHRQGLLVLSETQTNDPINVFGVIPECSVEGGEEGFMQTYGYDINWQYFVETDWDLFTHFVNTTCDISVRNAASNPTGEEKSNLGFAGDMRWLSPLVRKGVIQTGKFTNIEESFAFAKDPKWQKRAREFNNK